MQLLPIIERELRVAARHSRTWWRRVVTMGLALIGFMFFYLVVSRFSNASMIGREIFMLLSGFGMIYGLLAGPLVTVDCLSRERREGTLGLLFLTNLKGYDVVLGKMFAASFDVVLGLAAALPLVALPVLLGGVGMTQITYVLLAIMNIMFLSLAVGVCMSAFFANGRISFGATAALLAFATLGLPFLGEEVLHIRINSRAAAYLYMACPLYMMKMCFEGFGRSPLWNYWLNLGGTHALAWMLLGIACLRTRQAWRDLPVSALGLRWRERFDRWRKGDSRSRLAWRARMIESNAVAWLEGRDRSEEKVLWMLFLISTGLLLLENIKSGRPWQDSDLVIVWGMFAHYVLCLWIAVQSPRRLADDKHSGALEVLLCSPIKPATVVRGAMMIMWRRFGRVFLAMVALDVILLYAYFMVSQSAGNVVRNEVVQLTVCGLVAFPIQAYSLARIGVYQGLAQGNSLRATFMLVWKAGLLPWGVWLAFLLTYEFGRRKFRSLPGISDTLAFGSWAGAHVLVCGSFLAHANWHLRRNFRSLAAQVVGRPWWKRWAITK